MKSVRAKILLVVGLVVLASFAINTLLEARLIRATYLETLEQQALNGARNLQNQLDHLLGLGIPLAELDGFNQQCEDLLAANEDFAFAQVLSLDGKVLFHSDSSVPAGSSISPQKQKKAAELEHMSGSADSEYLQANVPVLSITGEHIGYISVGISHHLVSEKMRHLLIASVVTGMISLTVALCIFLLVITQTVIQPLHRLRNGILEIVSDDQPNFDVTICTDSNDEFGDIASAFTTTTQTLKRKDRALRHSLQDLHQQGAFLRKVLMALEQIPVDTIIFDRHGQIEYVNTHFMKKVRSGNAYPIGQQAEYLNISSLTSDTSDVPWRQARETQSWCHEFQVKLEGEQFVWYEAELTAVRDQEDLLSNYLLIVEDITQRKADGQLLWERAYIDRVTQLPNRILTMEELEKCLVTAASDGQKAAILYVDLDRFKQTNDSLGNQAGDKLLCAVGQRFKSCLFETDIIGRLGGDEFLVVLSGTERVAMSEYTARELIGACESPIEVQGINTFTGASIGIAIYPDDGENAEMLLRHADAALYLAKDAGKGDYRFFDQNIDAAIKEKAIIEEFLRSALQAGEFELFYQPKIDIATGKIVGCEALLRWTSAILDSIPPDRFIPIAEETGLILSIGNWVLQQVCQHQRELFGAGFHDLHIAINISARQLRSHDFLEVYRTVLEAAELQLQDLEIEITESLMLDGGSPAIGYLEALRSEGVNIAIDDFGTGYSSLQYLQTLPVNTIKMDKSFIKNITDERQAAALASAIISMAKSLELTVIAEGVENEDQLAWLREHNCKLAQGYLFCEPLPFAEFLRYLQYNERPHGSQSSAA